MNYIEFLQERAFSEGYAQRMFDEVEEKKEEKVDNSKVKGSRLKAALGIGGATIGGIGAGFAGNSYVLNKLNKAAFNAKDADKIKNVLLDNAKKEGVEFLKEPFFGNAAYMGGAANKQLIKLSKLLGQEKSRLADPILKHAGKDMVILGGGKMSQADLLAHELGHRAASGPTSKLGLGKIAHAAYLPSKMIACNPLFSVGSAINGFKSGQNAVKDGKKESTWNKLRSVAIPAAVAAPMLISEAVASRNGYKALKAAGASKELLNQSAKRLRHAFGSYATLSAMPAISGVLGRFAGKAYERSKSKSNDNK